MSGCAVMICSAGARFSLPLYFRSPMARDRLRFPFTLHSHYSIHDLLDRLDPSTMSHG